MPAERSDQIEQLYHDARQRDPANRAAFLKQACAGDDALRREVESLLAQEVGVESFLETPALELAKKMSGEDAGQSMIGRRVGPYSVVSLLAKGGMGEVYRARDTQLQRDVALKLLPKIFASDPGRLARFQREAQVLAALNHPSIAQIYGLEGTGTSRCIVMELVDGDTLEERLQRGAIPIKEALAIAQQMTEALEAAHEKEIVHRDLKPANVKVTSEGRVKVLDFGLAKPLEEPIRSSSEPPTFRVSGTGQGVILGTAPYMSPEQARGEKVDKRTDMWAFGCVLYELLTGRQAFEGLTVTDTLASVLKAEPDWDRLPAATPTGIRVLLRRCLQKEVTRRLRDASDARIEIEDALAAPSEGEPISLAPITTRPGWRRGVPLSLAVIALVMGVAIGVWVLKPSTRPVAQEPVHLTVSMPPGDLLADAGVAVSPDGTQLAYIALHGGVRQLYLRPLGSSEAKPLPGTEGAVYPFFSPNSQWIGFSAQGKMKKVSVAGGAPLTVCDLPALGGATWSADDIIVFTPSTTSGLLRVSARGGMPQVFTTLDHSKGEASHRDPHFLPGNKALLFTSIFGDGWDARDVVALRLETGERHVVVHGGYTGRFVPTGHLVYGRGGTLLAVPFDLGRLEAAGNAPVTLVSGITEAPFFGSDYSFSLTGSLVYLPASPRQYERRLVWVDRKGEVEPLPAPSRPYFTLALSPNGQRVAVTIGSNTLQLWIYDLRRGTLTPFASEGRLRPIWTPDSKRLVYTLQKAGSRNIFWRAADGAGPEERLTTGDDQHNPGSWSPDGKVLAFSDGSPTTGPDIWMLPIEGERKAEAFLQTPFAETNPRFSPDGRWLAYTSDESGRVEVYVQPFPGPGEKWQISTGGGVQPVWAPHGKELFYRNGDKMMAVHVAANPTFTVGAPRLLFERQFDRGGGNNAVYDVSPDGQRFLVIQAVEPEQPATQIQVVLNWFRELQQRVPVK